MFTINIDEGVAANIGHTGTTKDRTDLTSTHGDGGTTASITGITTTIDVTTDGDRGILGMNHRCHDHQHQEEHHTEATSYARTYYNII